jgi:hypothetical protein
LSRAQREEIDGRTAPELFMPYEIFDRLVGGLSNDERHRNNTRRVLDPRIRAAGYEPIAFWKMLDRAASRYVLLAQRRHSFHASQFTAADGTLISIPIDRDVCQARHAALDSARKEFGRSNFDAPAFSDELERRRTVSIVMGMV